MGQTAKDAEINEEFLYDPDWALSELLGETDIVISRPLLERLRADVDNLLVRSKYYNEHPACADIFEQLLTDIKFITMGARP